MMHIEHKLLVASPILRRKVAQCEKLARDVKIRMIFDEMKLRGDGYNKSVRRLSRRFDTSTSTIKRAIRKMAPSRSGITLSQGRGGGRPWPTQMKARS